VAIGPTAGNRQPECKKNRGPRQVTFCSEGDKLLKDRELFPSSPVRIGSTLFLSLWGVTGCLRSVRRSRLGPPRPGDGRFSGATRGFMAGHVAPEAGVGGPLAAVREGDIIRMDIEKRTIELEVSEAEMKSRLAAWTPRPPRFNSGVFQKYVKLVGSASQGAVTG